MSVNSSQLLSNANNFIKENRFQDALIICKDILEYDENNVNALLLATKCRMDLNIEPSNSIEALKKVLTLKPKNKTAIQGLRRCYEKYISMFLTDAVKFYNDLKNENELSSIDIDVITLQMAKLELSTDSKELVINCLSSQIKDKRRDDCLLIYLHIAIEEYIINQNLILLNQMPGLLDMFTVENETEIVVYVRNMLTFVGLIRDDESPEDIYTKITEWSIKNVYGLILFGRSLCDHYLMLECEETLAKSIIQLEKDDIYDRNGLLAIIINIRIENVIHLGEVDTIRKYWLDADKQLIEKYLWCQAFAVGCDVFAESGVEWSEVSGEWCSAMNDQQRTLCCAIMNDKVEDIELIEKKLSSFEWYLWTTVLRKVVGAHDKLRRALDCALSSSKVYYKVYIELAEISSGEDDYNSAVKYLEKAFEKYCSQEILEAQIDLHMKWKKYEAPLAVLDMLDIDNCSHNLLLKFVHCLIKLERTTHAISLQQRIVKQCSDRSDYWLLLGDLYLKRDNINHALKTYEKSIQLSGENSGICARLGNVFSLSYQESFDENDFNKSLSFFDRSLELTPTVEAVEGKASILFLHAEVSLKHLILLSAIGDINSIIKLLIHHKKQLKDTLFHMNLLGKVILLSILASIDISVDLDSIKKCFFPDEVDIEVYKMALGCFEASSKHQCFSADSHFQCGILELYRLNKLCVDNKRGQIVDSFLYNKIEGHFKTALSVDPKLGDAWKYLGYLYFKHGVNNERLTLDIQHCLSEAINISGDINRINDAEAAFYLGLLYVRENLYNLAREVFNKIKMDFPVNVLGYIGMYLLAKKDHTVYEQSEIARALMSFIYKDEFTNITDSNYQLDSSLVGLFTENMGFLVHDNDAVFDGRVEPSSLVMAMKTALDDAWTKYQSYLAIGRTLEKKEEIQYQEFGCFLGIIELLIGNFEYGKKLVLKSTIEFDNQIKRKLDNLLKLDNYFGNGIIETLTSLSALLNLNIDKTSILVNNPPPSIKLIDELLIISIIDHQEHNELNPIIYNYIETLIKFLEFLDGFHLTIDNKVSTILAIGSLLLTLDNGPLTSLFLETIEKHFVNVFNDDDRFSRLSCRLKLKYSSVNEILRYLYDQSLKQPFLMNRWWNFLEFGLEFSKQLEESISLERIFFITNRPLSLEPLDIKRYSEILNKYSDVITVAALKNHRQIFMKTLYLFPSASLHNLKAVFL